MDTEPPSVIQCFKKLEIEHKDKLEIAYGVEIDSDAIYLACDIATRYFDGSSDDIIPLFSVILVYYEFKFHVSPLKFPVRTNLGGGEKCDGLLQKMVLDVLEKACARLRHDLDENEEESGLDMNEYLLHRAIVELVEMKREKVNATARYWTPRVQQEYEDLIDKWHRFLMKWKPVLRLRKRSERRAEEIYMLEQARHGLVSYLQELYAANGMNLNPVEMLSNLGALITELAASPLTGVPPAWLFNSLEMLWQGLELRLDESLIDQEHVTFSVSQALMRHRPGSGPIGSFLLLYGSSYRRSELAKALAKQLFGDRDALIQFDLSDYTDAYSASHLIGFDSRSNSNGEFSSGGQLTDAVKRRPFSVVLLENVDKAHCSVIDFLIEILSNGRVSDIHGNVADFTKTLIIMTSHVIDDRFRRWYCKCAQEAQEIPMKDKLSSKEHICTYTNLLRLAECHFRSELFDKVGDVIIFKGLSLEQFMAVIRLQVRGIALSMTDKRLILYPSEAAIRSILAGSTWMSGESVSLWLEENMVPVISDMLANNELNDMTTIYIDGLVGTNELSFRLEKGGSPVEDLFMELWKESVTELRVMYVKENERVNMIYALRRNFFKLTTLLDTKAGKDIDSVAKAVQELVNIVDDLIRSAIDLPLMPNEHELALYDTSNEEMETGQIERPRKKAKKRLQEVQTKFCTELVRLQVIDVVTEAFNKSTESSNDLPPRPAMSFLFLGLTCAGKAELVEVLREHLVADDGTRLLIEINLSAYADPDALIRLMNEPLEQQGFSLLETVKMRPHSALLFSQVEKAHVSVFSALLSVLDYGMLSDSGQSVDFRGTIVILTSDLGNKKMLARLVGYAHQYSTASDEVVEQKAKRGFRAELLNRLDEMVLFDPFASEQLRKVARLPMRAGPHLE
ncbi:hypothetical protein RJ639_019130 [Escallonia herrerae]|uniref:ATPase AAA-type core domain-containing protein n=1 Tax=Escallonia herrerae TaxID=1293975 RepID=A0AA88V6X1_9ASTE|nr:hypothetical protein RJ639_019130 [Escallonia herrerae]